MTRWRSNIRRAERRGAAIIGDTRLPVCGYTIVNAFPHDPHAFTQGLAYDGGDLVESVGWWGASAVRRVRLVSGAVLQKADLPVSMFGEGLTVVGDEVISLTWRDRVAFRWCRKTFDLKETIPYPYDAWGFAYDGAHLYASDGSANIRVLDPKTLSVTRSIQVTAAGHDQKSLNDLEWVEGELWANVWHTDLVARIDPHTGSVTSWIDLSGLRRLVEAEDHQSVLNGTAYDPETKRLFVTGKRWPALFEIVIGRPSLPPKRHFLSGSIPFRSFARHATAMIAKLLAFARTLRR